jgi:hypothetical protein
VRVTGTAQSLEDGFRDQPDCFWMAVLDGRIIARAGGAASRCRKMACCLCAGGRAQIDLTGDHRLLLV